MAWVSVDGGQASIVRHPTSVRRGAIKHPAALFTLWSDEQRAAIGIFPANEDSAPTRFHVATGEAAGQINGSWQIVRTWQAPALTDVKAQLCQEVDDRAESIRAIYATSQAGMAMTYQEKFAQANAVDALGEAVANALTTEQALAAFPIVAASIGIEAPTLWAAAQLVIGKYQEWSLLASAIERARLGGKKSINESASVEAAVAAFEAIQWP